MPTPIRGTDRTTADQAFAIIQAASPRDVRPDDTALCGSFAGPVFLLPLRTACSALAASVIDVEVIAGQWMSMIAVGLSGIECGASVASKDILFVGHRFKMFGIHARCNATKMIQYETVRNRTELTLEHESVGTHCDAIALSLSIPISISVEQPNPTRGFIARVADLVDMIWVWRRSSVVPPDEAHRIAKHPAERWHSRGSGIRRMTATTLAQLHLARTERLRSRLFPVGGAARLASGVGTNSVGISSRNIRKLTAWLRRLAQGTAFFGKLAGHRAAPVATVSCPRWLQPRGGLFVVPLYQKSPMTARVLP